ncbi:MAG: DUF308 domain-containing protein [Myxococcaceae bacterium]
METHALPHGRITDVLTHSSRMVQLRGVSALVVGVIGMLARLDEVRLVSTAFGIYALLFAAFSLAFAKREGHFHELWGFTSAEALVAVSIAVMALGAPTITPMSLALLYGSFAFLVGAIQLLGAVRVRRTEGPGQLLGVAAGISIVFGLLALARPRIGTFALFTEMTAYGFAYGLVQLGLASRLRRRAEARA